MNITEGRARGGNELRKTTTCSTQLANKRSDFGEFPVSVRCSVISGTYSILNVHFVFRYLTLKNNHILNEYFMPYGLVFSVIYVILDMIVWGSIDYFCLHSAPDMRDYIRASFKELYNENIDNINFVAGMFSFS
ncbi:hypothetical protein CRE_18445 [Caenorhabditis remanei]|uniref:Uncharacterized protein n=1 Tax=Caenorhabditis remanei TaxID=31234 RepID=E3LKG0_CAERE|nr:hypothetical protein CRE_18445 [Caenorhabditis remanei]